MKTNHLYRFQIDSCIVHKGEPLYASDFRDDESRLCFTKEGMCQLCQDEEYKEELLTQRERGK